jgi:hypothetical protein
MISCGKRREYIAFYLHTVPVQPSRYPWCPLENDPCAAGIIPNTRRGEIGMKNSLFHRVLGVCEAAMLLLSHNDTD